MKKIALIHTVRTGYLDFGREVAAAFPEVEVTNLLDEHLAKEAVESGMSPALADRFLSVAQLAEKTGSDLLVCTCTSMIPVVDVVRPFLSVPLILIDDEMHRCAAALHQHVTVFATAESALKPTVQKYKDQVYRQTGHIPEISAVVCPEANIYMRTGNMQKHDELVLAVGESNKKRGSDYPGTVFHYAPFQADTGDLRRPGAGERGVLHTGNFPHPWSESAEQKLRII